MGCNSECHVFPVTAFKSPIWKDFGAEWCGFSRWYTKEYFLWLINMLKNSNWNVWFTKTYVYIYNYMCLFVFYIIYIYIYIDFLSVYWMFGPNIATWVAVVPICRALKSNHDKLTRGQDWKHLRSVVNHWFSPCCLFHVFNWTIQCSRYCTLWIPLVIQQFAMEKWWVSPWLAPYQITDLQVISTTGGLW